MIFIESCFLLEKLSSFLYVLGYAGRWRKYIHCICSLLSIGAFFVHLFYETSMHINTKESDYGVEVQYDRKQAHYRYMKAVDIHTHRIGGALEIFDASTCEVLPKGVYCSAGIHPLFIGQDSDVRLQALESKIRARGIVALGEVGLDRNSQTPMDEQIRIFGRVIEMSEFYRLPLIIHCVRAYPELLRLHNRYRPLQPWIIHGYNNNGEILRELLRHGCFIAGGKQLMDERSNIWELLPEIPLERLFLETDDSDYRIDAVYARAAERIGVKIGELERFIYDNFLSLNISS